MGRIWHHYKPDKRMLNTKAHRPGKEGINQRFNKDNKYNTEGPVKNHRGDEHISPHDHFKLYIELFGIVASKKPLEFAKQPVADYPNIGRRLSGQRRLKCIFLAIMGNTVWLFVNSNTSHHPENTIPTVKQ